MDKVEGAPLEVGRVFTVQDGGLAGPNPQQNEPDAALIDNRLIFEVERSNRQPVPAGEYAALIKVRYWLVGDNYTAPATREEILSLTLTATTGSGRGVLLPEELQGARRMQVEIINLQYDGGALPSPSPLLRLVGEITTPAPPCELNLSQTLEANFFGTSNTIPDSVAVVPIVECADEYDFEYVFFDEASREGKLIKSRSQQEPLLVDELFRNNATRLTSTAEQFRIFGLYRKGYIVARYRAVQYTKDGLRTYTRWSGSGRALFATDYTYAGIDVVGHQQEYNWQATINFAEEAKQLPAISYMDGTMRGRQNLVLQYGESNGPPTPSTEFAIGQQTMYDAMGRPAVSALPAPLYPQDIQGGAHPLRFDPVELARPLGFARDNEGYRLYGVDQIEGEGECGAAPMGDHAGAGKYYSPNNARRDEGNSFVPDGESYPFAVTRYTPDNTGRVRQQGGVGPRLQVGSGHDTRYFYGKPNQWELDRLFGVNVGDASHYQKTMVVDPNGQATVSYLDAKGRTIATALAGTSPENLIPITQVAASFTYTADAADTSGLTFDFENLSRQAETFKWNFAGLDSTTEDSPRFTFPERGTYLVCLTATGQNEADTDRTCQYVRAVPLPQVQEDRVVLTSGLNLISFDVAPRDRRITSVFAELITSGNLVYVQERDSLGALRIFNPTLSDQDNGLTTLEVGRGYMVGVRNADTVIVSGTEIDPSFRPTLYPGVNFVAYLPQETATPNAFFSFIPNGALQFARAYADDRFYTYRPAFSTTAGAFTLRNGRAYEIYLTEQVDGQRWVDEYGEEYLEDSGVYAGYDPTGGGIDTTKLARSPLGIGNESTGSPSSPSTTEPPGRGEELTVSILGNVRYDDRVESTYSLLVSERGVHDLCYTLTRAKYCHGCDPPGDALALPAPECHDCAYDITLSVVPAAASCSPTTAAGTEFPLVIERRGVQLYGSANDCFGNSPLSELLLEVGEYHITKTVRLSETRVAAVRADYLSNSACLATPEVFVQEYLATVDTSGCYECDCTTPQEDQPAQCKDYCRYISPCEVLRTQMVADVTPGEGQYARYETVRNAAGNVVDYVASSDSPLSIFSLFGSNGQPVFQQLPWGSLTAVIDGQAKPVAELTIGEFINNFQSDWADVLLSYHPEKVLLDYCEQRVDYKDVSGKQSSYAFDETMRGIETYAVAASTYGFTGTQLIGGAMESALSALVSRDVFFSQAADGGLSGQFRDRLYRNGATQNNVPQLVDIQLSALFTDDPSGETRWTWPTSNALTYQRDVAWRMLRDLYLSRKAIFVEEQQIKYGQTAAASPYHQRNWRCLDQPICAELACQELTNCSGSEVYQNYTARVNLASITEISRAGVPASVDQLLNQPPWTDLAAAAQDTLAGRCASNCEAYVPAWREELLQCTAIAEEDIPGLIEEFLLICATGCGDGELLGTSTVPGGVVAPMGNRSFSDVLAAYFESKNQSCETGDCNPYIINFPPPADRDSYGGTLIIGSDQATLWLVTNRAFLQSRLDFLQEDCSCTSCTAPDTTGLYPSVLPEEKVVAMAALNRMSVSALKRTLTVVDRFVRGKTTGLFPTGDLVIPAELNSGGRYCVYRSVLEASYGVLEPAFTEAGCDTLSIVARNDIKAQQLNAKLGWNRSWTDYARVLDSAQTCMICADPPAGVAPLESESCTAEVLAQAEADATYFYNRYVENSAADFLQRYRDYCMSNLTEQFQHRYTPHEYHYTLYYYDQAGNLAMTVPPAGVEPLTNPTDSLRIDAYRTAIVDSKRPSTTEYAELLPAHGLLTHYRYNNFDEVVESDSPDKYPARTWYDPIGRAVMSRDGRQDSLDKVSYTLYDGLGRPTEIGEMTSAAGLATLVIAAEDGKLAPRVRNIARRTHVTRMYYTRTPFRTEVIQPSLLTLRNRVAATTFSESLSNNDTVDYDFASHYDYDIGGNVATLVQEFSELNELGHRYKVLEYDYDLISGNVHNLYYQRGQSDQFTYHYTYDKLNRLVEVFSSEIETDHSRSNLWRRDAAYSYYDHGPLRRTIIGQDRLQGLDYAYTLQGWIKGVNGSLGVDYRDITRADINMDGFSESNYAISWLPNRDLYRYANQYFDGDYKQIGGDRVTPLYAKLPADYELFNGNIVRHFKSTLADNFHTTALVGEYDQLNRVRYGNQEFYGERPKQRLTSEGTPPGGSYLTKAVEAPSYDGNGNILHLDRWFRSADAAASTAPQQQGANNRLNYGYTPGTNLLATVDGQLASSAPTADLWQPFDFITGRHGYTYDKSGNLIRETDSEQQTGDIAINWNPYGKVTSVQTADKSTSIDEQYRTTFGYGPDQNRWAKRRLTAAPGSGRDATEATYYVRDAQGSTLATYGRSWDYDGTGGGQLEVEPFALKEQYLFGSTRLGEVAFDRPLVGVSEPPTSYGERRYELTNHLGNVTTVFSEYLTDYLDARDAPFTAPELIADRDYLAFGLGLERAEDIPLAVSGIVKQSEYRYAFNGKEQDDKGEWVSINSPDNIQRSSTHYDYGFRIYNPGLARFLSLDPLTTEYPMLTPYQFASNRPIDGIDIDGQEYLTYIINWYDNMESPEISVVHYNPNQHNQHGPQGRGLKYVVNYWETRANGLPQLNKDKNTNFFYARDAPLTEYGLYFGATGLYKITKDGELNKKVYDYSIDPVDYVDFGAWVHDKGYDAVGAAGASGLLSDVATIPADLRAIETWQEVVDLGVKGVDPHNGQPISQDEYNAASRGITLFKSIVFGDKARAVTNLLEKNIFKRLGDYANGRALRENIDRFVDTYFILNEDGYYVKREGYWNINEGSNDYGNPIPLSDVERPRP